MEQRSVNGNLRKSETSIQRAFGFFERLSPLHHALCGAVAFLSAGYGLYAYWGVYRWLAEAQLRSLNFYDSRLTLLFSALLVYIPLVCALAATLGPKYDSGLPPPPDQAADSATSLRHLSGLFGSAAGHYLLLAIACWGISLFQFISALNIGNLREVDLASLEAGGDPPGERWWQVVGYPVPSETQVWKERSREDYYIPFVSPKWKEGDPLRLLLEVHGAFKLHQLPQSRLKTTIRGLVSTDGVPGEIVAHWKGNLPLTAETILIDYEDSPANRVSLSVFFAAFGGVFSLLSAALSLSARRKIRLRKAP